MDEHKPIPRNGWLLGFHPQLTYGTTPGTHIDNYTFFSYHTNEVLHLSLREKTKAIECLTNIELEIQHSIDRHSQVLISRYIELLLDYCSRFYERQFITRNEVNKLTLCKMALLLDQYIQSGELKGKTPPSVEYCSDRLSLSACYLSDLLKFETGKSWDEYFQAKQIKAAKNMLREENHHIDLIAEERGFPNTQYFSELFQTLTGMTPSEYRFTRN